MQDMLIEVRASSPLVGVESLQVHVRLEARWSRLSQRSASELPEARSGLRWVRQAGSGLSPAGPAAAGFSTGQLPRRPRPAYLARRSATAAFQHRPSDAAPGRRGPEL